MSDNFSQIDFDAIRLRVASPEVIKEWSHGEVTKPETINYRTQKPEKDGLFCEKIFGPTKDWECYCGKYKRIRYKGIICDKCGVEVTRAMVRRERFGHIALATPVSHIWFLRGVPSKIGLALDMSPMELEKIVYFANFVVTKVNEELRKETLAQVDEEQKSKKKQIEAEAENKLNQTRNNNNLSAEEKVAKVEEIEKIKLIDLKELVESADLAKKELRDLVLKAVLSESAYHDLSLKYGHIFEASIGAEAIKELLTQIDLAKEINDLEKEEKKASGQKKIRTVKRLKLLKSLKERGIGPDWMVLSVIPVVPPDLRPMVALDGGRYAASDLNDLYRRVINRNNRLKKLLDLNAPEVIVRNEKRMLQEAVDALIDNTARQGKTVTASTGQKRMLKSLADSLKGKQGRFRQNLLGKRVDYSGRSVIVVGPKLKLHQCGLPKQMALELFRPFIIAELIKRERVHNVRSANRFIETGNIEVYDILDQVIKGAHVMLNRAPTLHRLGIQAFQPILIEGKAIQLHPLVCTAFNADFDGDQMAVHLPLTEQAKKEAAEKILSAKNLLKPATGDPVVNPKQDLVLGVYYLTYIKEDVPAEGAHLKFFSDPEEAMLAYDYKAIGLQEIILVRLSDVYLKKCGNKPEHKIKTTVGRLLFNEVLPEKMRFLNETMDSKSILKVVGKCLELYDEAVTAEFLDNMKEIAIKFATRSSLSMGIADIPQVPEKAALIKEAVKQVSEAQGQYDQGLLTNDERYVKVVEIWERTKDKVTEVSKKIVNPMKSNPINIMMTSGARGSWGQMIQLVGMKGSVSNPSGKIIELPVTKSFKEGIDVLEYFISTHGARKGLADTALKTASAGYLTRRLVDVAQDAVIIDDDCGTKESFLVTKADSEEINTTVAKRLLGRVVAEDVKDPKNGKVIAKKGALIDHETMRIIDKAGVTEARIRSVLACESTRGVCAKCYGWDLGYNKPVKAGTAVGIIAAQSIGEPGTQLTMRTFHSGGVSSESDITQGLPRVEEIFEARSVKNKAIMAPLDGLVNIKMDEETKEQSLIVSGKEEVTESWRFNKKEIDDILVKDGAKVKKGDLIIDTKSRQEMAPFSGKINLEELPDGELMVSIKAIKDSAKEIKLNKDQVLWVKDGAQVLKGDQLTEGALDLRELYELKGKETAEKYIIKEIQRVYSSQGQPLNDRHVEVITRQMFSRVFVTSIGDTEFLPGEVVEWGEFMDRNKNMKKEGKREAKGRRLLLGITKSSLSTSSFLSAASFQETAKILIDAAVTGKIDNLRGLKENVIIGRLIPVGSGYKEKK
ncbi:MAG: DNA-directed RNA polymerase subunit beta' [Patescibacteria group bacterium]|nr:DNA-directed RNA polymerase subunit beta' [Patescibacteria group bacterium]